MTLDSKKKQTRLYVDGQNFLRRIREVLRRRRISDVDITKYDFWGLLNHVFRVTQVDLVSIYMARVRPHKDTAEKSEELMAREEKLKTHLESQGFRYITAGTVRSRMVDGELTFEEKGVDVTLAVEMTADVCGGTVDTIILGSSDSDMQPVIKLAKERGIKLIYLGFQTRFNRGMKLTAEQTILIDNETVARYYPPARAKVQSNG